VTTTFTKVAPTKRENRIAARIGWAVLICATLYVCYFSHLGAIGFVGPDEPRYAWIARDMAETGDWITPRLYGRPWFEKPPLYYWEAAICFKVFGVSEAAARLPSAISALLATLGMVWLAWRLYRAQTARWLLLLLPTTVGMIGFSHAAATDMPFSAMLTMAMVCAAVVVGIVPDKSCRDGAQHSVDSARDKGAPLKGDGSFAWRRWLALIWFGVFLGLAVLAKGPAGIILCGGALFFWTLVTGRWQEGLRLLHPVAIAAFCVTALPWYILCARRNPDFVRTFIIEHNFKRYLTPEFQHIQPFWFYIPIIFIALLPWTAALLWTVLHAYRKQISRRSGFLLSWALFCVLFFSVSQSKLPGYVLPAMPAIVTLVARSCTRLANLDARSFGITHLAAGLVFGGVPLWWKLSGGPDLKALGVFTALAAFSLLVFALCQMLFGVAFLVAGTVKRTIFLFLSVLCIVITLGFAGRLVRPLPVQIVSARYLARDIQNMRIPPPALMIAGLKRSTHFGLNFYLHTELNDWDGDSYREAYVLTEGRQPCSDLGKQMACTNLWAGSERIDRFALLHLVPKGLAADPTGGGKTK
jgi:4-amino-4-deoxy-L-arabinose transferase-like glycosyltransferase